MRPQYFHWVRSNKANKIMMLILIPFFLALMAWGIHGEFIAGTPVSWFGGEYLDGRYQIINHGMTFQLSPQNFWINYSLCWFWTTLLLAYGVALLFLLHKGKIRKVAAGHQPPNAF